MEREAGDNFDAALSRAKRIATAFAQATECEAPADVVMACCIVVHRMDPNDEHLARFARVLLKGRAWVDEAMSDDG